MNRDEHEYRSVADASGQVGRRTAASTAGCGVRKRRRTGRANHDDFVRGKSCSSLASGVAAGSTRTSRQRHVQGPLGARLSQLKSIHGYTRPAPPDQVRLPEPVQPGRHQTTSGPARQELVVDGVARDAVLYAGEGGHRTSRGLGRQHGGEPNGLGRRVELARQTRTGAGRQLRRPGVLGAHVLCPVSGGPYERRHREVVGAPSGRARLKLGANAGRRTRRHRVPNRGTTLAIEQGGDDALEGVHVSSATRERIRRAATIPYIALRSVTVSSSHSSIMTPLAIRSVWREPRSWPVSPRLSRQGARLLEPRAATPSWRCTTVHIASIHATAGRTVA
jgi:hypothetical protein